MSIKLRNREGHEVNHDFEQVPLLDKMVESAAWTLRWNSNGYKHVPVRYDPSTFEPIRYTQRDWNQTLTTKINQLSAQIHRSSNTGGANRLIVSCEVLGVLLTNDYFDSETMMLGSRYEIISNIYLASDIMIVCKKQTDEKEYFRNNKLMGVIRVDGLESNHQEIPTIPTVTTYESKKRERRYLLIKK